MAVHASHELLTTVLRDELGFKGVVLTDWEDIIKLYKDHHIASNMKEAVHLAINAGIDMSMTPNDYSFNDALIELVKEGKIKETRLNESVRRILTMKQKLGLFETPFPSFNEYRDFGSDKHINQSLNAAKEAGFELFEDSNGFKQEGFGTFDVTINRGERYGVGKAYLNTIRNKSNLRIFTNSNVLKILFKNKIAIGIEVQVNNKKERFFARKEVLLSAGSINSPKTRTAFLISF